MHWAFVTIGLGAAAAPLPAGDLAVSVSVDHCLSVEQREVERLTALELGVRAVGTQSVETAESPVTRVSVSCDGEHVRLRVVDPLTGKTLERTLSLTAREVDVAGRAVALAAAELVLTSWAELTLTKAQSVPEPLDVKTAARPLAEERVLSRTERGVRLRHLLAFGGVTGPFDGVGLGYGGGLRLSVAFGSYGLGADWDLATHRAFAETPLGDVDATMFSSGLFARFTLEAAPLFADFGAGARGGIARLEGRPADADLALGSVVAGTWVGPAGAIGVGVRVASVAVRAGFEGGYVLHGVAGAVEQEPRVAVAGAWFSGSLGIGWAP